MTKDPLKDPLLDGPLPPMSEILRIAISDMDARLASGRYIAIGERWHDSPRSSGRPCSICLAGATFARWGIDSTDTLEMWPLGDDNTKVPTIFLENGEECPFAFKSEEARDRFKTIAEVLDDLRCFDVDSAADCYPKSSLPAAEDIMEADEEVASLRDSLGGFPPQLGHWASLDRLAYIKMADILEKHGL